jgi:hypothetical protein
MPGTEQVPIATTSAPVCPRVGLPAPLVAGTAHGSIAARTGRQDHPQGHWRLPVRNPFDRPQTAAGRREA